MKYINTRVQIGTTSRPPDSSTSIPSTVADIDHEDMFNGYAFTVACDIHLNKGAIHAIVIPKFDLMVDEINSNDKIQMGRSQGSSTSG